MESGKVVGGDYKGKLVGTSFTGKQVWILNRKGLFKSDNIDINADTVKKYSLVNDGASEASGSFVKETLWGTAAAINSANAKSQVLVEIVFKDGKKSLIQCSKKLYQLIQVACYK